MIDDAQLLGDWYLAISDRMEAVARESTGIVTRLGSSDLENPPAEWEANFLPMLDSNSFVRGSRGEDQFGDAVKAPDRNTQTRGTQIEIYKRGTDMRKAVRIAATIRAAIETDPELAGMVEELHYVASIPMQNGGEQKPFVLVALVIQFRYSTVSGEPWRRIQ